MVTSICGQVRTKVPQNPECCQQVLPAKSVWKMPMPARASALLAGISSIVSVVCAGLGIFYSLKGRRRVDRGETPKHRSLAQAGFVTGIVTLVLAVLATAFWALFGILYATDEGFRQDLEDDSDGSGDGFQTSVRLLAVLGRATWSLIS